MLAKPVHEQCLLILILQHKTSAIYAYQVNSRRIDRSINSSSSLLAAILM